MSHASAERDGHGGCDDGVGAGRGGELELDGCDGQRGVGGQAFLQLVCLGVGSPGPRKVAFVACAGLCVFRSGEYLVGSAISDGDGGSVGLDSRGRDVSGVGTYVVAYGVGVIVDGGDVQLQLVLHGVVAVVALVALVAFLALYLAYVHPADACRCAVALPQVAVKVDVAVAGGGVGDRAEDTRILDVLHLVVCLRPVAEHDVAIDHDRLVNRRAEDIAAHRVQWCILAFLRRHTDRASLDADARPVLGHVPVDDRRSPSAPCSRAVCAALTAIAIALAAADGRRRVQAPSVQRVAARKVGRRSCAAVRALVAALCHSTVCPFPSIGSVLDNSQRLLVVEGGRG